MKEDIILYGASAGGRKVFETLKNMGMEVAYFVDSDEKKWGSVFCDKPVKSPQEITGHPSIIIASELNYEKIEKTLQGYGHHQGIRMKEEWMLTYMEALELPYPEKRSEESETRTIFFELLEGLPQGADGIADWTKGAAQSLVDAGERVKIITSSNMEEPEKENPLYEVIENHYATYWEDVEELVHYLEQRLPCTVVLNKQLQLFYAAALVRKRYGEQIKLIFVIHSDSKCLYLRAKLTEDYVDTFVPVSGTIRKRLLSYGIREDKIQYHALPVRIPMCQYHQYSLENEPIAIGYAGRLTKEIKRCDRLLELIEALEQRSCNYRFYIAGNGEYEKVIKAFLQEKHLEDKVFLCGYLEKEAMGSFWRDKDLCVVVSEKEGCCQALMEAMTAGVVPVTTAFSAAMEYVSESGAGYLVGMEEIENMAEIICKLQREKEKLSEYGGQIARYARAKFDVEGYAQFLKNIVEE